MTKKQQIEERKERVNKEEQRLKELFKSATKQEAELASTSIRNLAFTTVQLEDLQEEIYKNGVIEKYKNGENQWGYKQSSALQAYNNLMKTFITNVKLLSNDIFSNLSMEEKDELQMFIEKSKQRRMENNK